MLKLNLSLSLKNLFKDSLVSSCKDFLLLFFGLILIFSFNIFLEYRDFLKFKESKHQSLETTIIQAYEKQSKNDRKYFVLKLKAKDYELYTTTYKRLNFTPNSRLSLNIINTNVSFKQFLSKSFYVPSYDLNLGEKIEQNAIISYFLNQHESPKIREFFGALFFALPVSKELRLDVNYYGIAHLIAISGYHIGLLFGLIFFILAPIYSFFQSRFFPYRCLKLDLSLIIFALLLAYAYLIGFVPSFIRSLIMVLVGFYFLAKNMHLISFVNLSICVLICISLFPQLLFSLGFFFSVLGVFFIMLYMHHFGGKFNVLTNIIFINIFVFLAMILPVLYFFPLISFQQILAVFLSFIFVIFYPLELFLHLLNLGFLLDNYLLDFFAFKLDSVNFSPPKWAFYSYLALAFFSIRSAWLSIICVSLNLACFLLLI